MGMAAFKNPNNQYKAITIAQTLGDDASSEELAGRSGSAVQCTEVTASNLSTVKTKATVVEKPLKDFRASTSDQSGWVESNGKWYYLNDLGVMQTGFVKFSGSWYYLSNSGAMFTGWGTDGSRWFYFDGSGAMKTGWYKENGTWYYLDEAGIMKTGWFKVGPHWYYAYGSGALAVSTTTPDGYRVNGNGEWVN